MGMTRQGVAGGGRNEEIDSPGRGGNIGNETEL